jgi:hypothetical protein
MNGFLPMTTWYVQFWSLEMPSRTGKPPTIDLSTILEGLLEETPKQLNEEYGINPESKMSSAKNDDVDQ